MKWFCWHVKFKVHFLWHQGGSEPETETKSSEVEGDDVDMSDTEENAKSVAGGKKDPILRRKELLVDSGLAEVFLTSFNQFLCLICVKYDIKEYIITVMI